MFIMLMTWSIMMSTTFAWLNHPMSLGFILLIQTILMCMISGFYTYSLWLSYILFLIMIGGMLILFTYVTSMAPNEMFYFSNKMFATMIITILLIGAINIMVNKIIMFQMMKNNDMMNIMNSANIIKENNILLNKLYNKPNNKITTLFINYLLLTMIMTTKITNIKQGPLRQKF
uniref:NADH-ubiquinone oxidoreductase chain 6 n=1 Tax=Scirtidae sp. GENSP01 TaxID=1205580 RepID=A0A0S2MPZ8_9COLE|nr:NADH deshydrogenase subunit 6 [Scirtidae sp. GENSP01]